MKTLALLLALLSSQDLKKNSGGAKGGVDQKAVDAAIARGADWLRSQKNFADELVVLTWAHAGLDEKDADFRAALERMLAAPLTRTYNVALQAMALEKIDRVKHQGRIAECAQFLVNAMNSNGMWSYTGEAGRVGAPTGGKGGDVPTGPLKKPKEKRDDVASGGGDAKAKEEPKPEPKADPAPVKRIAIKKQREGPGGGDHSNTQYAALGLRACHDAGIDLPTEVIETAAKQWRTSQQGGGDLRGWSYHLNAKATPTGSMTTAGIASLIIFDHILGQDYKQDPDVKDAVAWLTANFKVNGNPGDGGWPLYYLYGLERVGVLYGIEKFGKHAWYDEGAAHLLKTQAADGSWNARTYYDTCFAILFLKRATKSLEKPVPVPAKPVPQPKPEEPARPDVATGGRGK